MEFGDLKEVGVNKGSTVISFNVSLGWVKGCYLDRRVPVRCHGSGLDCRGYCR